MDMKKDGTKVVYGFKKCLLSTCYMLCTLTDRDSGGQTPLLMDHYFPISKKDFEHLRLINMPDRLVQPAGPFSEDCF